MFRVLLVDDEPIFLEFMRAIADWRSYDCDIVGVTEDGVSALSMIQELKPDIAFIDISMPRMDGLEVCRRAGMLGLPVRFVIMTGHDEFSFAYKAIKLGVDDFLLKPFSKAELEECLRKLLQAISEPKTERDNAPGSTFQQLSEGSTKYEIMAQMIDDYLHQNFTNVNLTLAALSSELSFESSYLRRVYKVTRGLTITQKLETIRMDEAKRLLRAGTYQGQEISAMIGFSDQYYFSKRFKQLTDMTPSEYRAKYGK